MFRLSLFFCFVPSVAEFLPSTVALEVSQSCPASQRTALEGLSFVDEKMDALRITVDSEKAPHQEWLTYGFGDITDSSTIAYFHWEKLKVPFKIEIAE